MKSILPQYFAKFSINRADFPQADLSSIVSEIEAGPSLDSDGRIGGSQRAIYLRWDRGEERTGDRQMVFYTCIQASAHVSNRLRAVPSVRGKKWKDF